mmetsp:Transcript_33340/g.83541  ORF Transcript_33340/g.83541 Transcript_33340/m.83541 type:complete len:1541 (-) Transcript_33340:49-4671(-)|eukprot:jgi/Tetstr1/461694/TSEL_006794.t1
MASPFDEMANAVENSFNPGHHLVSEMARALSGNRAPSSISSTARPDEAELMDACMEEAAPTPEQTAALNKLNDRWKRLRSRITRGGGDESTKAAADAMPKHDIAQKMVDARSRVGTRMFHTIWRKVLEKSGHAFPEITITYEDLNVGANALVGAGAINSITNALKGVVESCVPRERQPVSLLHKTSGVIKPGRATLVLGPPGAGKSLFMKAITGRIKSRGANFELGGSVRYNGRLLDDFVPEHTASYVDQEDNHLPTLTVLETMCFAFDCLVKHQSTEALAERHASIREALQYGITYFKSQLGQSAVDLEDVKVATEPCLEGGTEVDPEAMQAKLDMLTALMEVVNEADKHGNKSHDLRVYATLYYLGLNVCKDTVIGNALLRGISGGQRKRVTTGEFMVGGTTVMAMDEISTGLDSATTFSISQHLCEACRVHQSTYVISLLQPPPETVALFDDILLLGEGRIVYHGPREDVLPFFESLGFECPPRKDMASFLQEVMTLVGQHEYASQSLRASKGLAPVDSAAAPLLPSSDDKMLVSMEEMEQAFAKSAIGQALQADFQAAVKAGATGDSSKGSAAKKTAGLGSTGISDTTYAVSFMTQLWVVLQRQITLMLRNRSTTIGRLMQCIIMGIFTGLLFSQLEKTAVNSRSFLGVLFTAISFLAMGNTSQVAIILGGREVFFKHRDNLFFRSITYVMSMTVTQIPVTVLEVFFYITPVFFLANLYLSAASYFTLWLICFCTSCALGSTFRSIASFSKDMVMANSMMSLIILMLILTSGFSIVKSAIPPWWIWIYWISPFSWAFRAAALNEFMSEDPAWSADSGVYNSACGGNCTVGEQALLGFDIPLDTSWIWYGILYNLGIFISLIGVCAYGMMTTQAPQQDATVDKKDDDTLDDASIKLSKACKAAKSGSVADGKEEPMPFQPLTLVWQNIHYFVPFPKGKDAPKDTPEELELLKGITGYSRPGTLTALMGGSGAGKTTFMDVVAGRKTVGRITGDILVNGRPKEQSTWARVCGYVEQMDIHIPHCTVYEALTFSAHLRLESTTSKAQVKKFVDETMTMVDLWPIAGRQIGTPGGAGLSLEQRKRLTIGVELVANPGVIFMDEPTSGLDAKAAATVVRAVRKIGTSGRTVMVTIHQPSIEIFEAFDQLLLLQKGGYTIYFGSIGEESKDLIAYFRGFDGVEPVPDGYNPATWMLEVSGGAPQTLIQAAPYNFADEWDKTETGRTIAKEAEEIQAKNLAEDKAVAVSGAYAQNFWVQLAELWGRSSIMYWRNPSYNLTRWVLAVVYALLFGSLYWQQGNLPQLSKASEDGVLEFSSVSNIMGISYASCLFMGMQNLLTAIPIVSLGRSVFYRERSVSMYGVLPYAISAALIELPYIILQVILFVPIMYAMVGFEKNAGTFFYWILMFICSLSNFTFFGQLLVYMTPSPMLAQILSGAMNFFWNIFSGFSIPYSQMPVYLAWINRVSPTTWVIYGLVASQLGNSQYLVNVYGEIMTVSSFVESFLGYEYDFRWYCVLIIFAFATCFMFSAAAALFKLNFNIR